ncbi:MAG: NAD-dependent epimerase/dehydratase family protein [Chloroflexi bacterium]|nr:MAG: NAD-dependent epimerase/dehydratase family protein [Chloroflexota bacterium]
MILVTGAAGKTGRAVIRALAGHGLRVRALIHRPEQLPIVEAMGAHEALVGDMRRPATMNRAARDTWAVYHICPNMSPDEAAIGRIAIAAARAAGVQHFVYHSVLHPQTESMPHHWQKLRVEEHLFESGLPYTILQPAAYMQNVLGYWDQIVERNIYAVPYSVDTRLGMVDLEDVAAAAAVVLTEHGHEGATYELAGSEVLTQIEIARILSRQLGSVIRAESVSLETWERQARASGLGEYQIDTLAKMFRYYERYGFWGNPNILTWLLRRPPTTFAAFVERTVKEQLTG